MCAKGLRFSSPLADFASEVPPSPHFVKQQSERFFVCVHVHTQTHTLLSIH